MKLIRHPFIFRWLGKFLRRWMGTNPDLSSELFLGLGMPSWLAQPSWKPSFSQEGEDIILDRFFGEGKIGFYVDVGAHHPLRFSNTFFFYLKGWRGINIDANPGSMELFKKDRPRDINLECGVSEKAGELDLHVFDESALNTFSTAVSLERETKTPYKKIGIKKVQTLPLSELLERHLPPNQTIDFLSVDVEGLDMAVLRSNNWEKFKPQYLLVEDLECSRLDEISNSSLFVYLLGLGYAPVARTVYTVVFKQTQVVGSA